MPHMLKDVGPRGPIFKYKGLALAKNKQTNKNKNKPKKKKKKTATWLWFGMVIGIDHPHICNGKYAPYSEVCGPQGPMIKYKGPSFS